MGLGSQPVILRSQPVISARFLVSACHFGGVSGFRLSFRRGFGTQPVTSARFRVSACHFTAVSGLSLSFRRGLETQRVILKSQPAILKSQPVASPRQARAEPAPASVDRWGLRHHADRHQASPTCVSPCRPSTALAEVDRWPNDAFRTFCPNATILFENAAPGLYRAEVTG